MSKAIQVGSKVTIVKGCAFRNIRKGMVAEIRVVEPLGADYSHMVKIVLGFQGRSVAMYVRHMNRLADDKINANDGNPLHKIVFQRCQHVAETWNAKS